MVSQVKCFTQGWRLSVLEDETYLEAFNRSAFRRDRLGNRYELRTLDDGRVYQTPKTIRQLEPTPRGALQVEDLHQSVADICDDIGVTELRHFWALHARIRVSAG